MGIFESDEEALARRIKNIENMDKPIKFHQWFIPFCIFIGLPVVGSITIVLYIIFYQPEKIIELEWGSGFIALFGLGFYLLRRYVLPICSW